MGYNPNEVETTDLVDRTLGKTYANVLDVLKAMPTIRKTLDSLTAFTGQNEIAPTDVTADTRLSVPAGGSFLSMKLSSLGSWLVSTLPSLARGSFARTIEATLSDYTISVKCFRVKGDGLTDDTLALQDAFNYAVANRVGLYFPNGTYLVKGTIQIGTDPVAALTGLTVTGQSRTGVVIKQVKTNTPIFRFVGKYIHTIHWKTMSFTYVTMQIGQMQASVFTAEGGDSFYMSTFEDITAGNFYFFFDAPTMLFWGNCYRDMWLGDFAGGVNRITGGAGEPNCRFERMYITCGSAVEVLFEHQAMAAQYDSIEVNECWSGARMLKDTSGGTHVIGHWALEGAHYKNSVTLFDVQNSVLMADFIYAESISSAAGTDIYAFHSEGPRSEVYVRLFSVNGIGNTYSDPGRPGVGGALNGTLNASLAIGPNPIRFKQCRMPFAGNVRLTDVLGTGAADMTIVENWADRSRTDINDDVDVTLAYDSAFNQVFPASTGRTVKLPQSSALDTTNLFRGRGFRVVKAATQGTLTVTDSTGNVLTTLGAGVRGSVEVVWSRGGGTGFSWFIVDQRNY